MNKIDFIIVSYKSVKLADLLIKSIFKYTKPYKYHIYLVDNSDQKELFLKGNYSNFTYLKGDNNVPQKGFPSQLSSAHSHGLQTGLKAGKGEYVCFLDVDTCFLNEWTNHVIPQLEKNIFISHRWEENRSIARPQFLITKREYCDKYNIDLSIAYQDSGGIFTKKAFENDKPFKILTNSYNDKSLQKYHAIDPGRKIINSGEQAFLQIKKGPSVDLIPFFWHFGRGTVVGIDSKWYELLGKYLNNNRRKN